MLSVGLFLLLLLVLPGPVLSLGASRVMGVRLTWRRILSSLTVSVCAGVAGQVRCELIGCRSPDLAPSGSSTGEVW